MTNKLSGLKNLIWAAGILLCLLALVIGFFFAAISRYYGSKEKPQLNLSESNAANEVTASPDGIDAGMDSSVAYATAPSGELKALSGSSDGGQGYIDSLTFLVDSSMASLKTSGLTAGQVWVGSSGLSMADIANWSIVYPGDGSSVRPADAAMVAKPGILVIAVGSDGCGEITQESFVSGYESLIRSIITASPDTKVICCSVCPVTAAYTGADGLNDEAAAQVNSWIQQVCTDTGAWYADCAYQVTSGGSMMSEYAAAEGKGLNSTGLSAILSYLRIHALS